VAASYKSTVKRPWYVFMLKENLDIYALAELQEGDYRITNFDGEFPRLMNKEDGSKTRNVEEYVQDCIASGYTPPGFGVGSIGTAIYDSYEPGTLRFGNTEQRSRRTNKNWLVYLIPSNVIPLGGAQNPLDKLTDAEIDYREKRERERSGKLETRRTTNDKTRRTITWVDTSNGKIVVQNNSPGNAWRKCPNINISGTSVSSDLDSLVTALENSKYTIEIVTRKIGPEGHLIALKIGGQVSEIVEILENSAAPLRTSSSSDNTVIIRYR